MQVQLATLLLKLEMAKYSIIFTMLWAEHDFSCGVL